MIEIRRATWRDHEALWPLRYDLHRWECGILGIPPIVDELLVARMSHGLQADLLDLDACTISAWDEDGPLGYVTIRPSRFYLADAAPCAACTGAYVVESHRRGLVGFRLFRAMMRIAKPMGRVQMSVIVGNDAVSVPLLMHGAKPIATIYELEVPHGRGHDPGPARGQQAVEACRCDAGAGAGAVRV